MRILIATALASCASPPPMISATVAPMTAPPSTYCPRSGLGPWAPEIFPACPPYPYAWNEPWCGGNACARPCARDGGGYSGPMGMFQDKSTASTFAYDERGRWISETNPAGEVVISCTWRGDVIDSCSDPKYPIFVERDIRGRLVAITHLGTRSAIAWNAEGRVASIGRYSYDYDERGRLSHTGAYTLEYDARDRVIRAVEPATTYSEAKTIDYTYDGDHLVATKGPEYANMGVEYDSQGRVARASTGGLETSHSVIFDYDCKPGSPLDPAK